MLDLACLRCYVFSQNLDAISVTFLYEGSFASTLLVIKFPHGLLKYMRLLVKHSLLLIK